MADYKTGQRKMLYEFFSAHPDEQFSAKAIETALSGDNISLSAVYRNLAAMADEGLIRRSLKAGGREALFQYIGGGECRDKLHVTCTECGKTFHLSKPAEELVQNSLSGTDGFRLNKSMTVLYGVCKGCDPGRKK